MTELERFVIVSLGSIGRRHLANLRTIKPNAEIAVCRLSGAHREEQPSEHCDFVFHSMDEVIRFAPTAAVIAGPASTHASVAIALAAAGVHLLIEKPLSNDLISACEVAATVKKYGVVAMVGYNLRFMPGLRSVKQLIDERRIGNVLSVRAAVGQFLPDWRPNNDYRHSVTAQSELGGGALLELSHEIDYLTWIFGVPNSVVAQGSKLSDLEIDVEDVVEIGMKYDSPHQLISIHLDLLDRAGFRELRVIGSEGTLCWNAVQDTVTLFDPNSRAWHTFDSVRIADRNDVYVSELKHFLDCIDDGTAPDVDTKQGCDVLRVIEAARDSICKGCSITVEAGDWDYFSSSQPLEQLS